MTVTLQSDRINIDGRWVHRDGNNIMGFLNTSGGWDMYANNSGSIWTSNYGWLHDYFVSGSSNCWAFGTDWGAVNCYGSGNVVQSRRVELVDNGSTMYLRNIQTLVNCNCVCDCTF
jgi:hypothetical protein